ncbi:hypothetical protein BLS_001207 [Venturia inaequalis]|uniref:Expansin-like EG45 domain-containing protein n=1 Tax=Venturia inaequalis TaxID=5025 RepID=A0A8H3UXY7_VENIN|nr:hypothetical protein BLS_001207 [Venturia inaequalis]
MLTIPKALAGLPAEASHYIGSVAGGACGFNTYRVPAGIYGAALSSANWYDAGNCGACLEVTGPRGNKIMAMVVDKCPGCAPNFLNIMEGGYNTLLTGQSFRDRINVEWHIVSCRIAQPLAVQNAAGASPHWFSLQIQNSNYPVSHIEVSNDNGKTWESTVSRDYNYFEGARMGGFETDTVDLKISCFNGRMVYMKNVPVEKDKKVWATSNC